MTTPTNIVLIGYRGCGKTTIGKKLAEQLWKTFVDTDAVTCQRLGNRTIARIWEQDGEPVWRKAECEVTADFLRKSDHVLALGGGTVMQPAAKAAMQEARAAKSAIVIYLKADAQTLHQRIAGDAQSRATRPSLTQHGGGLAEVQHMLTVREPTYLELADKIVDVSLMNADDTVRHIIRKCL
jgi:shikimate kinase